MYSANAGQATRLSVPNYHSYIQDTLNCVQTIVRAYNKKHYYQITNKTKIIFQSKESNTIHIICSIPWSINRVQINS